MNADDIFHSNDLETDTKIELVAELFDFRLAQFHVTVMGDDKLKHAIMQHSISFYQDIIARLKTLSEDDKFFEIAKLYRKILNKNQEELQMMCEHMDDMYYR
jgi:hypothetical protein